MNEILQPPAWPRPKGYANGIAARGRQIYVAGQIGWDATGKFPDGGMAAQVGQALRNIVAVLAEAGAQPAHLVRLTWFVTSRAEYLAEVGEIGALAKPGLFVEIEATAVIPDDVA